MTSMRSSPCGRTNSPPMKNWCWSIRSIFTCVPS
jgi:hypothetical protein